MSRPALYGELSAWALIAGDSLELLAQLPPACIDAVITDPPYGIGFGGEGWDGGELVRPGGFQSFSSAWGEQARRVLKPGGHLVAFGTPRTFHRLVAGLEDAGLDIRDQLLWLYAQGVPKSRRLGGGLATALKPAYEPIVLARKPFAGTLGENINRHGTGALDIDAGRVPRPEGGQGFWPANVTLTHSPRCRQGRCQPDCPVALIDTVPRPGREVSRLFFASKANRREREAGCEGLPTDSTPIFDGPLRSRPRANFHPTVKPLALMRWLTRLACPPGGTVLDPFTGSGSTGAACVLEGRQFVGIERDGRYVPVACARIAHWATVADRESGFTPTDK